VIQLAAPTLLQQTIQPSLNNTPILLDIKGPYNSFSKVTQSEALKSSKIENHCNQMFPFRTQINGLAQF